MKPFVLNLIKRASSKQKISDNGQNTEQNRALVMIKIYYLLLLLLFYKKSNVNKNLLKM